MYILKFDSNGNTCAYASTVTSLTGTGGSITLRTPTVNSPNSLISTPQSITNTGGNLTTLCIEEIRPISQNIPEQFNLLQNYPNPFNPTTKIKFELPKSSFVKLVVYDILGSEVQTIVNKQLNAGIYEVEWDSSNEPSGAYYYKLTSGDFIETKKMVLVK